MSLPGAGHDDRQAVDARRGLRCRLWHSRLDHVARRIRRGHRAYRGGSPKTVERIDHCHHDDCVFFPHHPIQTRRASNNDPLCVCSSGHRNNGFRKAPRRLGMAISRYVSDIAGRPAICFVAAGASVEPTPLIRYREFSGRRRKPPEIDASARGSRLWLGMTPTAR